jgi:hypothetical protein
MLFVGTLKLPLAIPAAPPWPWHYRIGGIPLSLLLASRHCRSLFIACRNNFLELFAVQHRGWESVLAHSEWELICTQSLFMYIVGAASDIKGNESSSLSLCFFLFVNGCGNVENHGNWIRNFRKRIRAEESLRSLSFELVLKVALPPVRRIHLVQDRALAETERIAARVRDSAAGLPSGLT